MSSRPKYLSLGEGRLGKSGHRLLPYPRGFCSLQGRPIPLRSLVVWSIVETSELILGGTHLQQATYWHGGEHGISVTIHFCLPDLGFWAWLSILSSCFTGWSTRSQRCVKSESLLVKGGLGICFLATDLQAWPLPQKLSVMAAAQPVPPSDHRPHPGFCRYDRGNPTSAVGGAVFPQGACNQ